MQLPPVKVTSIQIGLLGEVSSLQEWFDGHTDIHIISVVINESYCYIFYTE